MCGSGIGIGTRLLSIYPVWHGVVVGASLQTTYKWATWDTPLRIASTPTSVSAFREQSNLLFFQLLPTSPVGYKEFVRIENSLLVVLNDNNIIEYILFISYFLLVGIMAIIFLSNGVERQKKQAREIEGFWVYIFFE